MNIEYLNQKIEEYQRFVDENPNREGVKGNIKTLIYIRDTLQKEISKEP